MKNLDQRSIDNIIRFLHMMHKPCYVGDVALYIKRSLEDTERLLCHLQQQGEVQFLSNKELLDRKICTDALIVRLVGSAKADKAYE